MFFGNEDELAVQTVASAAYRLVSDLKAEAGHDEADDFHQAAIFNSIRSFRRGTLPSYLAHDPSMMGWIREIAEQLPINADSPLSDATVSVPPGVAAAVWAKRNAASTFLQRPAVAAPPPPAEGDTLQLLMQAWSAYTELLHDELEAEGLVLWLYYSAVNGMVETLPEHYVDVAKHIAGLDADRRLKFCSMLVRGLNAPAPAS